MRHGVPKVTKRTIWTADVCAHQFRHEYVCMLAETDIPEAIAIQIVGHANMKMITRSKLDVLIFTPIARTKTPT